jgi:predicted nucleic acid-binding Zn ribbon protein
MRKSNEVTLKEAIEQLLDAYRIRGAYKQADVIGHWEEIAGKVIADRTKDLYLREKKLFLRVDSAALKGELIMMKSTLLNKVNEHAGMLLAEELILL